MVKKVKRNSDCL